MRMELTRKIYRSKQDYILFGVCSGLADYFEVDPTLIRLIFIFLAIGGVGILLYVILALIMPLETKQFNDVKMEKTNQKENKRVNRLGIILLIVGGLLLWNQFSPIKIASEIFWPVAMMVIGLWLVLKT